MESNIMILVVILNTTVIVIFITVIRLLPIFLSRFKKGPHFFENSCENQRLLCVSAGLYLVMSM